MHFTVARINKINSDNLADCAAHIDRKTLTPNADPEKTPENKTVGGQNICAEQAVLRIINEHQIKPRKNAVLAIESVISVSRDFFFNREGKIIPARVEALTRAAVTELSKEQHLGKLAKAVLHLDEMTPHMHVLSVPITPDGRLCAKHYLGHRQKYRDFQTVMGTAFRDLGIWRGVPNNRSEHQTVRSFYKIIDKDIDFRLDWEKLPAPPRFLVSKEAQQNYKQKLAAAVVEQVRDDVRVMEQRASMAMNEHSRRLGTEQRLEQLQHQIHGANHLW